KKAPPPAVVYVDYRLSSAEVSTYDPKARSGTGGRAVAYRSLAAAALAARPGQTVLIRGGTYCRRLRPGRSGLPGRPIRFRAYPGEQVVLSGASLRPAIDISDRSWIELDGLEVRGVGQFLHAVRSDYNVVRNCRFIRSLKRGSVARAGLYFQQGRFNRILNNTIAQSIGDGLDLVAADRNLVEGNTFRRAGHALWAIRGGSFNVIRGNFFTNDLEKIGEVYDCDNAGILQELTCYDCTRHNVIEGNRFAHTPPSGPRSPFAGIQYAGQYGIIRGNFFYRTAGPGLQLSLYGREANHVTHNRIYQNVFWGTQYAGIEIAAGRAGWESADNVIQNNVLADSKFVANDPRWDWWRKTLAGKPVQALIDRLDGFLLRSNIFHGRGDPNWLVTLGWRRPLVKVQRALVELEAAHPRLFADNVVADPLLASPQRNDFALRAGSPGIDRGAFLTQTTAAGSGTVLPVRDAGWFCDGFGIPTVRGDVIQLAGQDRTARVVKVDYGANVLYLAGVLSWRAGQGVALRYLGRAPDVGAREFVAGGNAPPIAEFTVRPRADEPMTVELDASASADADGRIVRYDWDFGDGERASGTSPRVSHTYAAAGRYTVVLRVTDDGEGGRSGSAAAVARVGRPALAVQPPSVDLGRTGRRAVIHVRNAGRGTLLWRAETAAGWLSIRRRPPRPGEDEAGGGGVVVTADRDRLAPGRYAASVVIDAGAGGRRVVTVRLSRPYLAEVPLVAPSDRWRLLKGTAQPPADWTDANMDDSSWLVARGPVGFGDGRFGTVLDDMPGRYLSFFLRRTFELGDPNAVAGLLLRVRYDDGFIAFINGREVARSPSMGRPGQAVLFDRTSYFCHDMDGPPETCRIPVARVPLRRGRNVLALAVFNCYHKSHDAGIAASLSAEVIAPPPSPPVSPAVPGGLLLAGSMAAAAAAVRRRRRLKRGEPAAPAARMGRLARAFVLLDRVALVVTAGGIVALSLVPPGTIRLGV
ncbi:MAG: right-handed parallel beta-helix repeat-containing protein, partial [Planctomycetes bacterium]|nr:right-handed parallel beta-helix repeat-containing protein [Planctomycetota bacterium]